MNEKRKVWCFSPQEMWQRRKNIRTAVESDNLDALCLFSSHQIYYLTGFAFIPTERPMACVFPLSGKPVLFVPRLEQEHAQQQAFDSEVVAYVEYPDKRHPMKVLGDTIKEMGLEGKRIGVSTDGYGGVYGYEGPKLSEILESNVSLAGEIIEKLMRIKSEEEIEMIKESARWGNLAHSLLQRYTKVGLTENEISTRASLEASMEMIGKMGPDYHLTSMSGQAAYALFRGQVGGGSSVPHAITSNARIQTGDVLVTAASADVGGYGSELERTMIVGDATERQKRLFELMVAVQDLAFETIRPGIRCCDVDDRVRQFYDKHCIKECWRHHTGHNLGSRIHESPFLDIGDTTLIEPGMVFSLEPGIYVPGFAGFRHSDTIVVTEDGVDCITCTYPRDLESLTIM